MAAGGWEWDIPYTTTSLSYIEKRKSELISWRKRRSLVQLTIRLL